MCIFRQLQVLKIESTYIDTLAPEKSLRRVLIAGFYVGMITRRHKEINLTDGLQIGGLKL